jgi:hypothetical protein
MINGQIDIERGIYYWWEPSHAEGIGSINTSAVRAVKFVATVNNLLLYTSITNTLAKKDEP